MTGALVACDMLANFLSIVAFREAEIDALIRRGFLPLSRRTEAHEIARALCAFLDRTLSPGPRRKRVR